MDERGQGGAKGMRRQESSEGYVGGRKSRVQERDVEKQGLKVQQRVEHHKRKSPGLSSALSRPMIPIPAVAGMSLCGGRVILLRQLTISEFWWKSTRGTVTEWALPLPWSTLIRPVQTMRGFPNNETVT